MLYKFFLILKFFFLANFFQQRKLKIILFSDNFCSCWPIQLLIIKNTLNILKLYIFLVTIIYYIIFQFFKFQPKLYRVSKVNSINIY